MLGPNTISHNTNRQRQTHPPPQDKGSANHGATQISTATDKEYHGLGVPQTTQYHQKTRYPRPKAVPLILPFYRRTLECKLASLLNRPFKKASPNVKVLEADSARVLLGRSLAWY